MASLIQDSGDEFGYDFTADEEELLLKLASTADDATSQYDSGFLPQTSARQMLQNGTVSLAGEPSASPSAVLLPVLPDGQVCYPNLNTALRHLENQGAAPDTASEEGVPNNRYGLEELQDGRSPLQRFRSFPQKPLSVSDLTSGAWCELQHWYTLTRLPGGRRTRTAAMRQGSKVHRKLEEEVHTPVRIDIMTKEDGFGLRLWNLVQGLRTLRDMGLTRELEVWGMVDGNLVNGIIDSVSSEHPNPEFEEELSTQGSYHGGPQQSDILDYFPPKKSNSGAQQSGSSSRHSTRYFIADVKTRGSLTPVSPAALRPAKIQLLLYHRFLSEMADGKLDYHGVLRRYGLDANKQFSDTFMSQIAELHDEIFFDTPTSTAERASSHNSPPNNHDGQNGGNPHVLLETFTPSSGGQVPDLLRYGTLHDLLYLVKHEINLTFPQGASSLGPILSVKYIHRIDEREIDSHDFPVSPSSLTQYLENYMRWWRGERKAFGVEIEEAFKCRSCEFAADCTWRTGKAEEARRRATERMQGNRRVA